MGIDVVVLDSNQQIVPKQVFIENGFPSDSLRFFNIDAWIPKFNSLIGQDDLIDTFAYEMKSVSNEMVKEWCSYIQNTYSHLTEDQERIKTYLIFLRDQGFSIVFW